MTRSLKAATWGIAGALVLALVGVAARRGGTAKTATAAPPPPEVSVLTVAPETVAARYEYVGQAEASRAVEVRSQVTGVIVARPYREGTDVPAGALLFRIDPTTYEAAYRSAEARLANAQRNLARVQPLLAARAVAQRDVDDAQTALDEAQAARDQAKKQYDDTFVRAEISGRAGRGLMQLGARVTGPGDVLTTVDQVDPIYVNFSPSDEDLLGWRRAIAAGRLLMPQRALKVQVTLADASLFPGTGTLNFADLALQPGTGTLGLRAELRNPQHVIVPGQFVRVHLLGLKRPDAILVPQRAVQQGLGGAFVWVVNDSNVVAARSVVTAAWDGSAWLIDQGLVAGDRVIVDGVQLAAPGQRVKPVPYHAPAEQAGVARRDSTPSAAPPAPLKIRSRP